LQAVLVVNYVEMMAVDSLSLEGFQAVLQVAQLGRARLQLPDNLPQRLKQLNLVPKDNNLYL
jgi:hypothetical protein